jgi:hypothetical protein
MAGFTMLLSLPARLPGMGLSCLLKLPEQQLHRPSQLLRGNIHKGIKGIASVVKGIVDFDHVEMLDS